LPPTEAPPRSKRARGDGDSAPAGKKARKSAKPRKPSPLAAFRKQTLDKKKALQQEKKRIDKELRAIIKDLGKLQRKPKQSS